ncbi:MAG: DNA polymerase III subunit delta [Calditrichaeota bacterium]|nr:DNA polymerase III subunit delta [Calditrichota bacterium]MCB9368167.1 DNA polymerase III subunit delta [Calditrichota bacterium]
MNSSSWLAEALPAFRSLKKAIAKKDVAPVIMLGGTEEYALGEAKDLVLEYLLQGASADFDFFEAEASAVSAGDLNEQLVALPMFGERRVVVLHDPESGRKDEAKQNLLKRYAANPSPTTTLLFVQPLERRPNKREQAALQNTPNSYWFFDLKSDEIAKFIRSFVTDSKKSIASNAVDYLIESSSSQLRDLKAKLDHLVLYSGVEQEITIEMAMRATGITAEVDMFGFDDALLDGNASRVLREARELLDKGMEELALLGRLRSTISRIWICGGLAARRASDDEFRLVLGGQVFKKSSFISASRRIGDHQVQDLLLNLLQIEMHAKSKSSSVRPFMFEWLWLATAGKKTGTSGTLANQWEYVR